MSCWSIKKRVASWAAMSLVGLLLIPAMVRGGTTGKISGVVTDSETGQPIAGALVEVVGTDFTAYTDAGGHYVILSVPVGRHTIVASVLGEEPAADETELLLFQQIEVRDVKVSVDLDTEQNVTLTTKTFEMGTIVVVAERPLILKDKTASLRIVESEQIQSMPTRGYRDLVALQPGVVQRTGNLLNVRGGRTSEVAYFVDGFSQQDPLTGISTTQINNSDIEEVSVVTGGFNAEYGWIASGAVNVTTRSGGDKLAGSVEMISDNFHNSNYDYNIYDATLSGPLVGLTDRVKFLVSGERRWLGDQQPSAVADGPLANNTSGGWTWHGKANWKPTNNIEFRLGGMTSSDKWDIWRSEWQFNSEHQPRIEDNNHSFNATVEHVLNSRTFYTLSGNYFYTERERGDGLHFDDIWAYGRPGITTRYDPTNLFWAWDDMNGETAVEDTVIDGRSYVVRGDEGSVWPNYLHRQSSYVGFDADIVSQVHPRHEMRAGVDFQRHTLRRYEHVNPEVVWRGIDGGGFIDVDRYGFDITGGNHSEEGLNGAKHPITFAAFLQDKFELEGLILNAGVRFDYLNVNTERLRDPENPLDPDGFGLLENPTDEQRELKDVLDPADLEDSRAEVAWSPRLGMAFPVSDGALFHASYGRFMQRPDLMNLYVSYDFLEYLIQSGKYFFPFGNPNLQPERTIAYEVGWTRQLGDNASLDVTAYYKDVGDLTQVANQAASPNSFSTYTNSDFGTIKGLEFTFDMRRQRNISLHLSYSLSHASGTGSTPNTQSNIAWFDTDAPATTSALDFDQRHKLVGIFDLRAGAGEGPMIGQWHPFENAGINFTFQGASGFPYTSQHVDNEVTLVANRADLDAGINSLYTDWTMNLDIKATKAFRFSNLNMEFQLWVINVFNQKNVAEVWQSTGQANTTGWLETDKGQTWAADNNTATDSSNLTGIEKYNLRENDPSNYGEARQIRAGLKIAF